VLPITLDVSRLRLAVVGTGLAALRRLHLLQEAGARDVAVFAPHAEPALAAAAGAMLRPRWPRLADLAEVQFVFIADPPENLRAALADAAGAAGAVVHVEDAPALSDAQAPAVLRRGALTVAVSTAGGSPALAVKLRDFLGCLLGPEWQDRIEQLSRRRCAWRASGVAPEMIATLTEEWISRRGWLDGPAVPAQALMRGLPCL